MRQSRISKITCLLLAVIFLSWTPGPHKASGPKNIILIIGDGMGLAQICAAMVKNGDHLNIELFKHIGLSKTSSSDDYVTDSAAGATALSIGKKTYNNAIGVDKDTIARESILETAEKNGLSTGMVVTCTITHATPGSFIAHQPSRYLDEAIAADFLKTDIDVFIGGGRKYFTERKDGRNLVNELNVKGYQVKTTLEEVEKTRSGKIAGLLYPLHPPKMSEGRGNYLERAVNACLNILGLNKKGFFMMIEGSQIDWGGHNNDGDYMMDELIDLDNTIGKVLEYAKKDGNTLVILTADHETGGLSLPHGSLKDKKIVTNYSTEEHTGIMVPVFAYGPGSEEFSGIYENTEIYVKMKKLLGL